jgi:hypothetical protein
VNSEVEAVDFSVSIETTANRELTVRSTIEIVAFLVCVRGEVLRQGASRLGMFSVEKETGTTTKSEKTSI